MNRTDMKPAWDIFCRVIDNFGDIGVAWRLARNLNEDFGFTVRLWVDDLASFKVLAPAIQTDQAIQPLGQLDIRHWTDDRGDWPELHDVVIEAFACGLPESLLQHMAAQARQPVWINLEYLSAEDWVEGCHRMQSRHPRLPLTQHFFFPGFSAATGGLLCESTLLEKRDHFLQQARGAWREQYVNSDQDTLISLFCYENPALSVWLDQLSQGSPVSLLVADGKPRQQVSAWLGQNLMCGAHVQRGALSLYALPFLAQPEYDQLLWACDLNMVRGEDSCARAQWAAQPFVWQIYPTEDGAHLLKLDALMQRIRVNVPDKSFSAWQAFTHAWNHGDGAAAQAAWPEMHKNLPQLRESGQKWQQQLSQIGNLAGNLAEFVRSKL